MTDESLVDSSAIKVLNELKRYRHFCEDPPFSPSVRKG